MAGATRLVMAQQRYHALHGLEWSMEKVALTIKKLARYLVRKVLVYNLVLAAVALLSFIVTGNLSFGSYGERMFWIGLFVFLLAGMMALAHMIPPRMLLFPYNIRRPEDAKKFVRQEPEIRAEDDRRLDTGLQIWLIGFICLLLSAVMQSIQASLP